MSELSLVTLENSFLIEPDELSSRRPGLWPSEASVKYHLNGRNVVEGKCMRASWFRSMGYEHDDKPDPNMAMKWDLGNSAEAFSVERWKKMGIYKANNVKFFDRSLSVSGELDSVIKNPQTNGLIGVECKSFYGHFANQEICGSKRPPTPGKPKADHFLQAIIYRAKYPQLEQYRLYYIERGDGHRVEFEVGLDPEGDDHRPYYRAIEGPYWSTFSKEKVPTPYLLSDIYNRFIELKKRIIERDAPDRDFSKIWDEEMLDWAWMNGKISKTRYEKAKDNKEVVGDWQCNYCQFGKQCSELLSSSC